MRTESTKVLVIGGGLVGLSAGAFLAWRDVPTIVVERHLGSSLHPRAVGFLQRTTEQYRAIGLESQIPPAPPGVTIRRVRADSLAGTWSDEIPWTPPSVSQGPPIEYSPCSSIGLAQDKLEPVLREHAVLLGADVRLGVELVSFEQDETEVRALVRDRSGAEYSIHAEYLVAADGHRSPVREALGIGHTGRGHLRTVRSILFRAPLDEYLKSGVGQFQIEQPGFSAFLTTYGDGRWLLIHGEDHDLAENTMRDMVIRAIGRSDLDVGIITTGRFEITAAVADRFVAGRILLAGDAAHTLPPNRGAYGVNTGIEDAHNLAWKLASVLAGESAPELLATYDEERRPIALVRHQQIFARFDGHDPDGERDPGQIFDDVAMSFGQIYRSAALPWVGDDLPPARRPEDWAGQPGTRAPHLWLDRDGERLSTLDLFQRGWVLLAEDPAWTQAAAKAGDTVGIAIDCQVVDADGFRTAYGLDPTGASLIRPDGYIAWRAEEAPEDPAGALADALVTAAMAPSR